LVCLLYLAACASQQKEAAEGVDSTAVVDAGSEAPRSVRHRPKIGENGLTFDVDSTLTSMELTIFGKSELVPYWISKFYSQDRFIKSKNDTPSYSIKSVDLIEDEYVDMKGECVKRPVLVAQRVLFGEEYYDIHFLTGDQDVSSEKVTYDGTIAQST